MKANAKSILYASAVSLLILISFAFFGAAASASGLINAINPQSSSDVSTPALVPPLLVPPPGGAAYAAQVDISQPVVAPDKRPIAQLGNPIAAAVKSIRIDVPEQPGPDATQAAKYPVYYTVLASVEYQIGNHLMLVTTAKPSPAAAQMSTAFGDEQVQLGGNVTAWSSTGLPGGLPNRVVFLREDIIVTVVSDMSIDELKALAAQIIVR